MIKILDSTLIAAIISAIVSIIIALITLKWTRKNDEKKLTDEIKKQEINNRLNALQKAIETLQNIKNELRYLKNNIRFEDTFEWKETQNSLRILSRNFDYNYSNNLPSLKNNELDLIHEITHFLSNSIHDFNRSNLKEENLKEEKISLEIERFRAKISDSQKSLMELRTQIIDAK